eukprot:m.139665 g.139665  ORF g.139665 m.139665 type:complete len:55 (+) comp17636_c0_seq1:263-427(+)
MPSVKPSWPAMFGNRHFEAILDVNTVPQEHLNPTNLPSAMLNISENVPNFPPAK